MDKETIKEVFYKIRENIPISGENPSFDSFEWILQSIEHILLYTESPIEKKFLLALMSEIVSKNKGLDLFSNPITIWNNQIEDLYPKEIFPDDDNIIILSINPTLDQYRPDVFLTNNRNKSIIFEIDGFQFHSTRKQLTHDKKRERDLSKLGHKIYRFTGTEIHNDVEQVAKEALEIIYKEFKL